MAANIFNQRDYQGILKRIKALTKAHPRKWGTMDINQMLEHCGIQLKLGLGIMQSPGYEGSAIMRTWLGRKSFFYVMPWPKGLPTPSKMDMIQNEIPSTDFETEKSQLLSLLEQVQGNPGLGPHPFFGPMNEKEWGRLIWKHLDHHLQQFGG